MTDDNPEDEWTEECAEPAEVCDCSYHDNARAAKRTHEDDRSTMNKRSDEITLQDEMLGVIKTPQYVLLQRNAAPFEHVVQLEICNDRTAPKYEGALANVDARALVAALLRLFPGILALAEPCGCEETYPQLQPGKINHGPGCGTPRRLAVTADPSGRPAFVEDEEGEAK